VRWGVPSAASLLQAKGVGSITCAEQSHGGGAILLPGGAFSSSSIRGDLGH
jgi:hypothetical protein